MTIMRLALGVASLALAAPLHAQAELASDAGLAPAADQSGYRLVQEPGGFQLIEHGVWEVPSAQIPGLAGSVRTEPRPRQTAAATGPNAFHRAAYLPHVYAAEAQFGLPAGLLDALIWTESRYNPFAISKAGAAGLGQLMPGTAKELGVANRFDPLANLSGAARYLRQLLDRFGMVHLALAAYNAGPGTVERAKGIPQNGETPGYVRNVLDRWRP
jgi:soluble lytic murein transglycosylase-like protein